MPTITFHDGGLNAILQVQASSYDDFGEDGFEIGLPIGARVPEGCQIVSVNGRDPHVCRDPREYLVNVYPQRPALDPGARERAGFVPPM